MLLAVLAVALATYVFDCGVTMTAEDAMQCCKQMPCSSHGHHDQNCCKSMPTAQASFVQSSSTHLLPAPVLLAVLPANVESPAPLAFGDEIAAQCHAPPPSYSPSQAPLRI
jgi:hypothetical protein